MQLPRTSLLAALIVVAPIVPLAGQVLTPYDVFTFQDFLHSNSETNGRLAVGGNGTFSHFGVGAGLPSTFSDFSLVVGGNMTADEGSVFAGATFIGGTLTATNTGFPAAHPPQVGGTSPVDFSSDQLRLTDISNHYALMSPTGSTQLHSGELNFVGNSSFNIFSVTMAMLQAGTAGYEFVTPFGATNIVNVLGSSNSSALNNTAFFFDCTQIQTSSSCLSGANANTPADAARTLWNFNQQSTLDFGGPVHGSILAPNADVTFGPGDVVGTVVVKSAAGNAEFYNTHEFTGELPVTSTPEPASIVLMATGLVGIAGAGLRKKARRSPA